MHSCCMELLYCFIDLVYILVVSFGKEGLALKMNQSSMLRSKNTVTMRPSLTRAHQNRWILRHLICPVAPQGNVRSYFYEVS
jgi:hypothetical protein